MKSLEDEVGTLREILLRVFLELRILRALGMGAINIAKWWPRNRSIIFIFKNL